MTTPAIIAICFCLGLIFGGLVVVNVNLDRIARALERRRL